MLSRLCFSIPRDQASSWLEAIYLFIPRIPFLLRPFSRSAGDVVATVESPRDLARSTSATVSFLTDSFNLSPNVATDAVNRLKVKHRAMASHDSQEVIEFFLSHGFTEVQIAKLIARKPYLRISNVKKTIKPKLDFLLGTLGLTDTDIVKLVSCGSGILNASLERRIRPIVAFLSSHIHSSKDVITVVKRAPWIFDSNITRLSPKFELLRDLGVPDSEISKLATMSARSLTQSAKRFNYVIECLGELGLSPKKRNYALGFHTVSSLGMVNLTRKMSLYRSYGITEDEVLSMFRRAPSAFTLSDQKIRNNMDFFIKNLNWKPQIVLSNPRVLTFSLEQRIIPRALVRSALLDKGFLKSNRVNCQLFFFREDDFLQKYVLKFEEACPELLNTYKKAKEMATKSHS